MSELVLDVFEVGDSEFSLRPLKNTERLSLVPDLFGLLAPLFTLGGEVSAEQVNDALEKGVRSLAILPKLTGAFEKRCQWRRVGDEKWNAVGGLFDVCFQRRTVTQLRWLIRCVQLEFGDFLAEDGLNALAEEASGLISPGS